MSTLHANKKFNLQLPLNVYLTATGLLSANSKRTLSLSDWALPNYMKYLIANDNVISFLTYIIVLISDPSSSSLPLATLIQADDSSDLHDKLID